MSTVRRELPPVTLTCSHLYAADTTFRSAIEKWVVDRRCPIALGDFLEEYGLPDAADCARWCATEPDRPVYPDLSEVCGPFPKTSYDSVPNYWCRVSNRVRHANEVPGDNVASHSVAIDDTHAAIVFLLDSWIRRTE